MSYDDYARDGLAAKGYTENFEFRPGESYQGRNERIAQNPEGKWGSVSYSYGSCEVCDPTYDWTDDEYRATLTIVDEHDTKPEPSPW